MRTMLNIIPNKGYGKEVKNYLNSKLIRLLGRPLNENTFIKITKDINTKIKYSVYADEWDCKLWNLSMESNDDLYEICIDYRGPKDKDILKALVDLCYEVSEELNEN